MLLKVMSVTLTRACPGAHGACALTLALVSFTLALAALTLAPEALTFALAALTPGAHAWRSRLALTPNPVAGGCRWRLALSLALSLAITPFAHAWRWRSR
jgi:hypothetical protein